MKNKIDYHHPSAMGQSEVQHDLARYYEQQKDTANARYHYELGAREGTARGHSEYGFYLDFFSTCRADAEESFRQLLTAAKQGDLQAQLEVAATYGIGTKIVRKSAKQEFFWYMKAARRGSYMGAFGVGRCYAHGFGVKRDLLMARAWLHRALVRSRGRLEGLMESQGLIDLMDSVAQRLPRHLVKATLHNPGLYRLAV